MPNGDIVSGCSDGVVRVFSESSERWVSDDELRAYDEEVARQALPSYASLQSSSMMLIGIAGSKSEM